MAEVLGIVSGVAGLFSLAIQITQIVTMFGSDWKSAPEDEKNIIAELLTLRTLLQSINDSTLQNPDFAKTFKGTSSVLLSQLGEDASEYSDLASLLEPYEDVLEGLLKDLRRRAKGKNPGWEKLKGFFLAQRVRDAVEALHRVCQILNHMITVDTANLVADTNREVKEGRKEVQQWIQSEENKRILNWLTKSDQSAEHNDYIRRKQEGTCLWLIESKEFQEWRDDLGGKSTLFCQGIPGAGKTIMTASVVEHLQVFFAGDRSVLVSYYYCNYKKQSEQDGYDILTVLLRQLSSRSQSLDWRRRLAERFKDYLENDQRPSYREFLSALSSCILADGHSKVYIAVDALDECIEGVRNEVVTDMLRLQSEIPQLRFFVTSRVVPEVAKLFTPESCLFMQIRAEDSDVERYIAGHTHSLPSFVREDEELIEEIKSAIIKSVDGM